MSWSSSSAYLFLVVGLQPQQTARLTTLELVHGTSNNVLRVWIDTFQNLECESLDNLPSESLVDGLVLTQQAKGLLGFQRATANLAPSLEEFIR